MEWQLALLLILGTLLILFATGMPIAFAFVIVNMVGVLIWWGGEAGLRQLVLSMVSSVNNFVLLPVPLFIIMGELMFHSGIAFRMLNALDKWLGQLLGRLALLTVAAGAALSTMSGTSLATTAILGTLLVPDMEKRGYKKPMSLGPILGSGGLALMIPPSTLAVILGAIGQISIGKILIAIIIPGLLMAVIYAAYIIIRCRLQPSLAPAYEVPPIPLSEKVVDTVRYVLPLGLIVFLVVGVIFLGIATPSEGAATGALGTLLLAAAYRKLNWEVVKKSFFGTLRVTIMLFVIIAGAKAFSQVLSYSGASRGLIEFVMNVTLSPISILIAMMVVVLILGTFMDLLSIMLITLPIFMPIVHALDFNPVWFAVLMLLNMEMGTTSPPFGLNLFVMKGVAPPDTTMGDIYKAALPFLGCDAIALALIIVFPMIALWLPGVMF